ncbi:MAG TPA: hypothetical protein VNH11_21890 [Pirellulales bacterium]|nr:hypothetical protein [Pirellulales bacterium]
MASPLSPIQIQHLHLAGTVSIPRHFPELGRIWYLPEGAEDDDENRKTPVLRVEHALTHTASVTRTCLLEEVRAVFVPKKPSKVDLKKGRFLLGAEIANAWPHLKKDADGAVLGIVHVFETARTHTEVSMGLTAIQSVEFSPPQGKLWCE